MWVNDSSATVDEVHEYSRPDNNWYTLTVLSLGTRDWMAMTGLGGKLPLPIGRKAGRVSGFVDSTVVAWAAC